MYVVFHNKITTRQPLILLQFALIILMVVIHRIVAVLYLDRPVFAFGILQIMAMYIVLAAHVLLSKMLLSKYEI